MHSPLILEQKSFIAAISLLSILCLIGLGCSDARKKPADLPDLHPCKLHFTMDGTDLANASITMIPTESAQRWSASGNTDNNGNAVMFTHGHYEGVPEGDYKITAFKTVKKDSAGNIIEDENSTEESVTLFEAVPSMFHNQKTTSLEMTVVAGKNENTFDLGNSVLVQFLD